MDAAVEQTQERGGTIGVWPRIALVTPVYNSGKYIERTILSVLAQHYPNLDYFIDPVDPICVVASHAGGLALGCATCDRVS